MWADARQPCRATCHGTRFAACPRVAFFDRVTQVFDAIVRPRSLRAALLMPYVVLTLLLALAVGYLSYRASVQAVISLSEQAIDEIAKRIQAQVDSLLTQADTRLYAAAPLDDIILTLEPGTLDAWRQKLWQASYSTDPEVTQFVYFGGVNGRFVGIERRGQHGKEWTSMDPEQPRVISRFNGRQGNAVEVGQEAAVFDPRERVWFKAAVEAARKAGPQVGAPAVWSAIHNNFRDGELSVARSRAVFNLVGQVVGVVASDVPLAGLGAQVAQLRPSRAGLAMVVQADGALVASSMAAQQKRNAQGQPTLVNADNSEHALVRAAWAAWKTELAAARQQPLIAPVTAFSFEVAGRLYRAAVGGVGPAPKDDLLGWTVLVAVPDDDQLVGVRQAVFLSAALGTLAAVLVLLLGLRVLDSVVGAIRQLQVGAQRLGRGELDVILPSDRRDEIGQLAQTLNTMQTELSTDRLTGLTSRTALHRQVAFAIEQYRQRQQAGGAAGPKRQFAVLFLDLNGFKAINDQLGHDVGDAVLTEVGKRLRGVIRPGDVVARLGGDEFVMVLWRMDSDTAIARITSGIEAALALPLDSVTSQAGAADLRVGTALGVAFYPEDGQDTDSLLKAADARMYDHKGHRAR